MNHPSVVLKAAATGDSEYSDTQGKNRLAPPTVGQPPPKQSEYPTAKSSNPEQPSHPSRHIGVIGWKLKDFRDGRSSDQRQKQKLISIEQKSDSRDH